MTHYGGLVVLKKGFASEDADTIEATLERMLMPFYDGHSRAGEFAWDWFQIGGRWTGTLSGYDPEKDEANFELCDLCEGTGTRTVLVPMDPSWKPVQGVCNGCGGEKPLHGTTVGLRLKWPGMWKQSPGDIMPVGKALELLPGKEDDFYVAIGRRGSKVESELNHGTGWLSEWLSKFDADQLCVVVDFHD